MDDYVDYDAGRSRSDIPTEKTLVRIHRYMFKVQISLSAWMSHVSFTLQADNSSCAYTKAHNRTMENIDEAGIAFRKHFQEPRSD